LTGFSLFFLANNGLQFTPQSRIVWKVMISLSFYYPYLPFHFYGNNVILWVTLGRGRPYKFCFCLLVYGRKNLCLLFMIRDNFLRCKIDSAITLYWLDVLLNLPFQRLRPIFLLCCEDITKNLIDPIVVDKNLTPLKKKRFVNNLWLGGKKPNLVFPLQRRLNVL